ncbi:hypothetical protein TREES_T100016750 [Tupaia chinensis]|uniref:MFS-type transporter SLC18B1 n=1 Tax=Tupaia chinensis TaxID=246437 RepID=L9L2P5_TUPCH|nr:hypothetical protein TREES_T100016750 [Tupaia chinensis]
MKLKSVILPILMLICLLNFVAIAVSLKAEKKGASNTVIGMIFGCYALSDFLASLVFGRYHLRIVLFSFSVLDQVPAGPVFIAMCFLVRMMDAMSFSAAITASSSILAKAFPNNVATVMGSLETFSGLGLVLGPPLGGLLYQSFGYEVPFIFLGCIVLLMVPLNMYIIPNYDADPGEHSFWKLVSLPKIGLLAFVINSLSSCFGFLDPTLSLFVLEKFNLPAGYVGLVFLGSALSYAISSPLFGLLSDRMPHLRKWFVVLGSLMIAGCYMFLGPIPILHIKRCGLALSCRSLLSLVAKDATELLQFPCCRVGPLLKHKYKSGWTRDLPS